MGCHHQSLSKHEHQKYLVADRLPDNISEKVGVFGQHIPMAKLIHIDCTIINMDKLCQPEKEDVKLAL